MSFSKGDTASFVEVSWLTHVAVFVVVKVVGLILFLLNSGLDADGAKDRPNYSNKDGVGPLHLLRSMQANTSCSIL